MLKSISENLVTDGILNSDYAEGRKQKRSLKYRLWRRSTEVDRAIDTYIPNFKNRKIKVLDLGCADGLMLKKLSKKYNIDATGLELSKGLYEMALANCDGMNIINKDINDLSFLGDSIFDLIICTAVLEHLEDSESTIYYIEKLLAPQGITVWTVPDLSLIHISEPTRPY